MAAMRRFYEDILGFPLIRELSPAWIEYRVGDGTSAARVVAATVRVPRQEQHHRRAFIDDSFDLGDGQIDVGE